MRACGLGIWGVISIIDNIIWDCVYLGKKGVMQNLDGAGGVGAPLLGAMLVAEGCQHRVVSSRGEHQEGPATTLPQGPSSCLGARCQV